MVGCWCGYLTGARCRLAYGPADATATHCLLLQQNQDWFLPFWHRLTRVVLDKGPLNGCVCACVRACVCVCVCYKCVGPHNSRAKINAVSASSSNNSYRSMSIAGPRAGPQHQTHQPPLLRSIDGTDRRTDTWPFYDVYCKVQTIPTA